MKKFTATKSHEETQDALQSAVESAVGMSREALSGVTRAQLELQRALNDLETGGDLSPRRLEGIARDLRFARGALELMPRQIVAVAS